MKSNLTIVSYLLIISFTISCTDGKKENAVSENIVQQAINPNGDSELALLMRAMFDEAQAIKMQIENGEPVAINLEHEKILTAHATEPEKAASAEYKAFADVYLQSVKNLQTAKPDELVGFYDTMVVSCMACHKTLCPGPMVKIKKLQ